MKNKSLLLTIVILFITISSMAQLTGTYTDPRDGKTYKTVNIGTQTWMAENLAYKSTNGCWAYNNDTNNVTKNGYLYNWVTAKKVCPVGWHLPDENDFLTLIKYINTKEYAGFKLKSRQGWKKMGDNTVLFSAIPSGVREASGSSNYFDRVCMLWTASTGEKNHASAFMIGGYANDAGFTKDTIANGFSVRCLSSKILSLPNIDDIWLAFKQQKSGIYCFISQDETYGNSWVSVLVDNNNMTIYFDGTIKKGNSEFTYQDILNGVMKDNKIIASFSSKYSNSTTEFIIENKTLKNTNFLSKQDLIYKFQICK